MGIERLQKVLLVLLENITVDDYEEFEKSLITHNHMELHKRIRNNCGIEFNADQNGFYSLSMVSITAADITGLIYMGSFAEKETCLLNMCRTGFILK